MPAPQFVRAAPCALQSALAIAAVNRHDVREREALLHYRDAKQLYLGESADIVGQVGEEQRRIEVALMIGDEDIRLIVVEMLQPRNVYARARSPRINPQSELRRRKDEI